MRPGRLCSFGIVAMDAEERRSVVHIIAQENRVRARVVDPRHLPIYILPGRVPHLHLHIAQPCYHEIRADAPVGVLFEIRWEIRIASLFTLFRKLGDALALIFFVVKRLLGKKVPIFGIEPNFGTPSRYLPLFSLCVL